MTTLKEALKSQHVVPLDNKWDVHLNGFSSYILELSEYDDLVLDGDPVTVVGDVGGFEGGGEERYIVFKWRDQYIMADGYYNSWEGSEFYEHNLIDVLPEEYVTVRWAHKK